tara:strand:+ start:6350 stop:6970 length:621 start_codon:yes stop_codon:yes gene_type:complete
MLIQAQVGPIVATTSLGVGTNPNLRLDNTGGLAATQLNPRYYETTYRRQTFTIANQTGVTTSAALATTYVGLCIANPTTSTINAVITKVGYAFLVAQAAATAVGIMTGVGASITAAVTPRNRYVGSVTSQVLASTSLTLPGTPVLETILATGLTGAITTSPNGIGGFVDLEGSLILPPGAFACFYTSTASGAASFLGSFQWVEVPV